MQKTLSIPASVWALAKTEEDRQALVKEYTVPMSEPEVAAMEEYAKQMAAEAEEYERKTARQDVLDALEEIDRKSIRALREGNSERLAALEAEAIELRKKP